MSDFSAKLPDRPSLVQLRKQARELLQRFRAGQPNAVERFHAVGQTQPPKLADAQFVVAREYGFASWARLKRHVDSLKPEGLALYEALAADLATAYAAGDVTAIREINWNYGTSFAWQGRDAANPAFTLADARQMVAHSYGIDGWAKLVACVSQPEADPRSAPVFLNSRPPFYQIDWKENALSVRGPLGTSDWRKVFGVMKEYGITKLNAGAMPDVAMPALCALDHVTRLDLGGFQGLTDSGLKFLAGMPQLEELGVGGWKSPITDEGLAILKELPNLRRFRSPWTQGISDASLAGLSVSEHLIEVNLIGAQGGDGTIAALAGKQSLRKLTTGQNVTDVGIRMLYEIPAFKEWKGGEPDFNLMSFDSGPVHLMLDGPFTDSGLRQLSGLNGIYSLSFFWHCPAFTSAGLAVLKELPRLGFLGCQDHHCDDEAMRHIASIPGLRMLMGQGAVAGPDGFRALSHSSALEYFWGRDCPNFESRCFAAMSEMPSLKGFAVSWKNVALEALAALPRFPSLRQLMPMDVVDEGFRHIGECENLEALWCMYCRETGDIATGYLAGLRRLKQYYAGMTKITDRSLEILGKMESLEKLELWQCAGLTDTGVAHLAKLPNLRELSLDGLPGVTRAVMGFFPAHVRVNYTG